ncbi:PHA/PHB synthase family protein [Chitinimonas koreensis]|uniref:PHA/PHB synthase family protein n=1 Tax=Chitinimonas koreensis TaxID=356302 RepID=UPI00068706FC|nr:class I poly(R)-hydroxyalkanoic acid synthase [Chitinimonas koreensis]QNM97463.1 class I poly(R)-hydroxyalkanoic acid synthase [Chitinimonas koreensis]
MTDSEDRFAQFQALSERMQSFWQRQLQRQARPEPQVQIPDPGDVQQAFGSLWQRMLEKPQPVMHAQWQFWQDYLALSQQAMRQYWLGEPPAQDTPDKRFKDEQWASNQVFAFLKQAYLLASRHIQDCVAGVDGLDAQTARQVSFYTRQFVDAMAPTNFLATNPTALKATLDSGGENLVRGFQHLIKDLERNGGRLMPRMTDLEAFEPGKNLAVTPGKVVYENALMQLIQYAPAGAEVHATPLLIVPPWINKFYILDLKPKNSLIRWLVEQGHTVFVISWVNPDESHRDKGFADYMREGPLAALDAIEAATGERQVNVAAYCIGGTLLAATLGWMAAARDKRYPASRIRSATFFTTMIDFAEPGELGVFIDERQLAGLDAYMDAKGYLEGHQMAGVFNLLRENDLIWSFVVNNYLLGREPMPFDLLYWNCDSTRMPAAMHRFYLRSMYQHNLLKEPGGVELDGVPIDLTKVRTPAYFVSAREDHIAPWQSTYAGARLFKGPVRFVLGGSGHIAGIVNPPAANKYGYVTNPELAATPADWLAGAEAHEGSWWLDWAQWLGDYQGKRVAAREPGTGKLAAIEDAPGRYVKAKLG